MVIDLMAALDRTDVVRTGDGEFSTDCIWLNEFDPQKIITAKNPRNGYDDVL
jgi:hypothetical protein